MIESLVSKVISILGTIPFSFATWFVLAVLGFIVWLFHRANNNPASTINWEHLIVDSSNNRASPYKLGYLIGVIVSTWIVITFANGDKLSFDILGTYLTFLLGGAGVNSYFKTPTMNETIATVDAGSVAIPPEERTSIG